MKNFTIRVRNGFYLGDLCYVLADDVYDGIWGEQYKYKDGAYVDPATNSEFAMVGTAWGDGCFYGTDRQSYPVDAGIIGVCDAKLVKKSNVCLGRIIQDYSGKVRLSYENGTITIAWGDEFEHQISIETDA